MNYDDVLRHYDLIGEVNLLDSIFRDWHFINDRSLISKNMNNEKLNKISHIKLYCNVILQSRTCDADIKIEEFEKSINDNKISIYRSGGGIYTSSFSKKCDFVSFTTSKERAYFWYVTDATDIKKMRKRKKEEECWSIELKIPIDEILLFHDGQEFENEVIVSGASCIKSKEIEWTDDFQYTFEYK